MHLGLEFPEVVCQFDFLVRPVFVLYFLQVKQDYEEAQAKFAEAMEGTPKDRVEANMALKRARALVQLSD